MDPNNTIPNAPVMPNVMPGVGGEAMPNANAMPEVPATPVAPVVEPSAPMNPATMATPGAMPEMPVSAMDGAAVGEAAGATPSTMSEVPSVPGVPTFDPTMMDFGATDPLTVPEGPKAPDPVEEELKMPLKAADPVPGSIGSAVSVPTDQAGAGVANVAATQQTPSVAFNDPAMMQNAPAMNASAAKPAKKMNKTTLILAGVLGVAVIIVLVVILIMQMM